MFYRIVAVFRETAWTRYSTSLQKGKSFSQNAFRSDGTNDRDGALHNERTNELGRSFIECFKKESTALQNLFNVITD